MISNLPNFSFTYLLHLLMGVVSLACYWRLKKSYERGGIETIKHFSRFFAMFAIFFFIMGLPLLVPTALSPVKLGAFFIFSHMFLYASFASYILVPFELSFPSYKKYAFSAVIAGGVIITFANLIFWNEPTISGGITLMNVKPPVGPLIGILDGVCLIIFGTLYFLKKGLSSSGITRKKFLVFSVALLILTMGGPLHDNATSLIQYILADILVLVGMSLLMIGIYAKRSFSR